MKLRLKFLFIGSLLKSKIAYLLAKKIRIQLHILKYVNTYHVREATFFTVNNEGRWEAVSEGIPISADINVTPKFVGMNAIVSCRFNDDSGYHVDQCFQAEITLPENHYIIFTGTGDSTFFMVYKNIYESLKVKDHVQRR